MSPAPPPRGQPPRRNEEPEHPAERGMVPGKSGTGRGAPPPKGKPKKEEDKGPVARAGKFFEVRKGRSESGHDEEEEDGGGGAPGEISLPRSITQEAEEADLKRRLNRDELVVDLDKRHSAVKLAGVASGPSASRRRSTGLGLLLVVVIVVVGLFLADKYHLIKLGNPSTPAPSTAPTAAPPK